MNAIPPGRGFFPRLGALLCLRCPRCFRGSVFRGTFAMNDPCPVCGQIFQREEGYFLGAMYVSYALGCAVVCTAYFVFAVLFPDVDPWHLCFWLFLAYLPLIPLIFRYSRVGWLHLDYLVSPDNTSATLYEKLREAEVRRGATSPGTPADRTPPR